MKFLSRAKINLRGKRVLVRVDFNVPVIKGKIEDDFRIRQTMPTLDFLKKRGAKIILISHGDTSPVEKYLNLKKKGITLLENARNFPGEEKNDPKFAKKLASTGDIYVNEAFSVSHRKHASVSAITRYLPSYAGLLFEKELNNLKKVFKPKHPFLLILGGIKFETKFPVIKKFLSVADKIFVGGAMVVRTLKMPVAKNPKMFFPIGDPAALDANKETLKILEKEIKRAKFILWNGPLGDYEKGYDRGTKELAKLIAKSKAVSIIGGGDTVAVIRKSKIPLNNFSFVSTAGGAMLEFLAKGTLPGIKALEK